MKFTYNTSKEDDITIFSLAGELIDKSQASGLIHSIDELIDKKEIKLIFDLKNLRYVNSSGLNVLINIFAPADNVYLFSL